MNHRIGDRRFLFAWQAIRAATQPAPEATTWRVAGVRWSRHRLSQAGPEHSFSVEVHRLDHEDPHHRWGVMVVTEHWWDETAQPAAEPCLGDPSPWLQGTHHGVVRGSGPIN